MTPIMLVTFLWGIGFSVRVEQVENRPTVIEEAIAEQRPMVETDEQGAKRWAADQALRELGVDLMYHPQRPELPTGVIMRDRPVEDPDFELLKDMPSLLMVVVDGGKCTDEGLAKICELPNLRALFLFRVPITDAGLDEVARLSELRTLYIGGTKITDAGLKRLKCLPRLIEVDVQGSQITDESVRDLQAALTNARVRR